MGAQPTPISDVRVALAKLEAHFKWLVVWVAVPVLLLLVTLIVSVLLQGLKMLNKVAYADLQAAGIDQLWR